MTGDVRRATIDDLDDLLDVQEEASIAGLAHIFPQDTYPFPRAALRERWRQEFADPSAAIFVSTDDEGTVTGFAAVRGNELLHFGTASRTWGTGTAQRLHGAVLNEWLRDRAPTTALLRVFADNLRARRFYARLGWTETGRTSRTSFPPHPVLLEYQLRRPPDLDHGGD